MKEGYRKPTSGNLRPSPECDTDTVLIRTITKSWFREVHRTDCTQKVCIDFLGFINLEVIIGLGDDIIGIMEDQNQIVAYVVIILDNHVIEMFQKFRIAQPAFTQSKKILLFASLFFFLFGKVQLQQVVANRTGECLFGNIQIFIDSSSSRFRKVSFNSTTLFLFASHTSHTFW